MPERFTLSDHQIDEAGQRLREWVAGGKDPAESLHPEVQYSLGVVALFRSYFGPSLRRVTSQLTDFVMKESERADVTARPKPVDAILRKLLEGPQLRLSQMEDIGGCRAKLPRQAEVGAVVQLVRDRWWPEVAVHDYVSEPTRSGYRATHIVVVENGRSIEIQLRTEGQNRWADAVEAAEDRLGFRLKKAEGPGELVRYFELEAYRIACDERGEPRDANLEREFEDLKPRVVRYF